MVHITNQLFEKSRYYDLYEKYDLLHGLTSLINGNHTSSAHLNSTGNTNSLLLAAASQNNNNNDLNALNNNNPLILDKNIADHLSSMSGTSSPPTTAATSPTSNGTTLSEQPDPDFIKMFVGQVPKSMDEEQLREMFEEYGRVHSINVLRDKVNGVSKGCCFVTFFTRKAALKAQDALHNVKTLSGMHHPIQMKPADSENRNERKLFVGMLNKKLNENDVRKMFEQYGTIEECTVLRDQNGQSKGCAFVTFATKQSAIVAIKSLHQSQTMDGCSAPLVVKFADTQKEKEQKKIQQIQANLWNIAAATNINNMSIPLAQSATSVTTPIIPNPPQQASPVLATDAISPASLQLLQQIGLQQQLFQDQVDYVKYFAGEAHLQQKLNYFPGLSSQTDTAAVAAAAAAAGLLPQMTVQNLAAIAAMTAQTSALNSAAAQSQTTSQLSNAAALLWSDHNPLTSPYVSTPTLSQLGSAAGFQTTTPTPTSLSNVAITPAAAAAAGKQIEGPDGCNLFIYHLPQEFTDTDLASSFLPFGNVISAKVFIDKQTNLSKCFGFVSFDSAAAANAAIKGMHGFQIGTKRLKVQLKKPKDSAKPY